MLAGGEFLYVFVFIYKTDLGAPRVQVYRDP